MNLLSKTRKINAMLQASAGKPVNFKEMADTLGDIIDSNVFIVSRKGKIIRYFNSSKIENERMKKMFEERQFPEDYTKHLFEITETSPNIRY